MDDLIRMSDLISRQAAIDAPEKFIKDCNPEHFVGHQKFIEYMDNAEIGSFGNWQFANGFNMGLTAAEVAAKKLPPIETVKHGKWLPHPAEPDWDVCSVCGIGTHRRFHGYYNGSSWDSEESFQYCPWCGAELSGGKG